LGCEARDLPYASMNWIRFKGSSPRARLMQENLGDLSAP
jgi:hypothetical protein